MENRNGYRKQTCSALWRSLRDGDFKKADVWAILKEMKDLKVGQSLGIDQSPLQVQRNLNIPSASRMIPRTSSSTDGVKQQQYAAPVKIPDWSKKKAHNKNNYDDDVYDCKVPPHEFIAERLAKTQISSFSVFEGVGRTLKGRDLSKVRNAVLTRTGFLE